MTNKNASQQKEAIQYSADPNLMRAFNYLMNVKPRFEPLDSDDPIIYEDIPNFMNILTVIQSHLKSKMVG